jgi:hypothetical protein
MLSIEMTRASAMEINAIRPFLVDSLKTFYDFRKEDSHLRSRGMSRRPGTGNVDKMVGEVSQSQDLDFSQSQGVGEEDGFGSQDSHSARDEDHVESRKLRRFRS